MIMRPRRITVHCSATKNGEELRASVIDGWHRAKGWNGIGYHLVIQPSGEVERGRALNEQGAHVEGDNEGNVGICLIGLDKFTRAQWDALRYQIDSITMVYSIPPWEIYTHSQFPSAVKIAKTCPNIPINVLLAWYVGHREDGIKPFLLRI